MSTGQPTGFTPRFGDAIRSGRRLGYAVLRQVVLDPFQDGRLGLRELPPPLRALASLTLALIAGFLLLMLAGSFWGDRMPTVATDLGVSYPRGTIQLVAVGIVIATSLIFVATIHMRPALRWAGWVAASLVLTLGTTAMIYFLTLFAVVPITGSLMLLIMMLRRRRRSFHLGELAFTTFVLSSTWATSWVFYQVLLPGGPTYILSGTVRFLIPFIAPLACLAGLALAEIATSVATGTIAALHEERPRMGWWWLLGVLAVAVLVANGLADPSDGEIGWSALMAGLCVAGWIGIGVIGRSERGLIPVSSYQPEALWDGFRTTLWTLALLLSLPFLVYGVLTVASLALVPFLDPEGNLLFVSSRSALSGWQGEVGRDLVVSLVGLLGAVVQVRRGRTVSAQLLWVVGVVCSMMLFDSLRPPFASGWSVRGLVSVLAVVVLAVGVWLLHHGRLSRTGAVALASALAVTLLFPIRELLSDPITALLGTGLASVLLLSAVWQLLTEGAPTRRDTAALPREARLLFFLGYQLLWVITATVVVLTRESLFGDVVIAVELGDRVFGTTLLLVAVLGLLTVALRQPRRDGPKPLAREEAPVGTVSAQPDGGPGR